MATPIDAPYKKIQRQPPFNMRSVLEITGIGGVRLYSVDGRGVIHRRFRKVKGKAAVKAAKRARIRGRLAA